MAQSGLSLSKIEQLQYYREYVRTMWKVIWMALSTPFKAVVTGQYDSYKISRNPFSYIGLLLFGLLLIPFTIFVYPIIILISYLGLRNLAANGFDAEILATGLRVFSEKQGDLGVYNWCDISCAEQRFSPPVFFPAIRADGDKWIEMHLADFHEVLDACRDNGVNVNKRVNFQ